MRMRDIAERLGVSAMTVSRALRADSSVAPATRQAILAAISQLGYVPDQIAGSLSSRRSGFVAVLVPSLNNTHFSETVLRLGNRLEPHGRQLLIGDTDYDRSKEEGLVRAFLARKPEAIVLTADGHTAGTARMLARAKIPVIEMWEWSDNAIGHVVGFSNQSAMAALVLQMFDRGYRNIAYLGESGDEGTRGAARRRGYLDALAARNSGPPRVLTIGKPPAAMSDGERALTMLQETFPEADLAVCVSDPLAFGLIAACQRRGLSVPEDLAVAGFGDFEISRCAVPDITTVAIDAEAVGDGVADVVREVLGLSGQTLPLHSLSRAVPATPVIRRSAPGRTPGS
jgi:LacI family transcriptional regulator, gluconate utilization system Gnt-I transcriptional repressor